MSRKQLRKELKGFWQRTGSRFKWVPGKYKQMCKDLEIQRQAEVGLPLPKNVEKRARKKAKEQSCG